MSTGEDEPSSGLNGRLRPRKCNASPKTTPAIQKSETKPLNEKPKRTGTPSKVSPTKPDDFPNKTAVSPVSQVLCSFCDKTFGSRQAVAKHVKRVHSSTSKQDFSIQCLYCNHSETEPNDIIRHMIDSHPNQYFACLNCQSRFLSTSELAEHKLNVCEKQKPHYRNKLRQKAPKKTKSHKIDGRHEFRQDSKEFSENHGFNGIVISCELKPSHVHDEADIEDNIPTNLILPSNKSLANAPVIEKNAVIVLGDLQWNKRIPPNFNFHNTDADQILSRLGVVHRGPRTGEPNRRDWLKIIDETNQKFERCFDTSFYSKVASNVQENLAKFLDGSCNFNPDPDNTIKTRKLKNSVAINTAEGFPILLAFEQYSRNVFDGYMPRSIAPKHKWKWDNLEHDKTLCPEQIKRDSHANNCIITLVSSLDIWTQLCMRQKFEDKFKTAPIEKKAEKQNIIGKELKEILEKRELPTPSSQVVKFVNPTATKRDDIEFPASLGLAPAIPNHDIKPAVLSGEWVRPRCYICCACGFQARDSRALSTHITTQHPNAQIQHYEIVGERLLNSDISKHLYVPPSQVSNRTRPLRGYRECTKCKKSVSLEDLHQHMLDCAGDTPTVRRKCRARPFGVRKRRTRLPDNTIRKKIRKEIRTRDRHRKTLIRPRQKNRSDVGDAETIRKMLADLPAKRHRVLVNPLNSNLRPRRKFDNQRNKLKTKKNIIDDANKKTQGNTQPSILNVGIERLNKKVTNLKEADSRMMKNNSNQVSNCQSSTSKRNSPLTTKRNLRLRESKGTSDQGTEGKKCADSGNNSRSTLPGSGGSGEAPFNTRQNGNQSHNSNGHDNQEPGCSRQNDNNNESSGQPPNVPLKHSIARLTANSGTHDKSVQFHHLFLVQQECNNIPQHVPTRQNILFENEVVISKLDKPPLNNNHGGTMDPMAHKSKLNKPRKGLNDCIAMLKNKLVEPSSQEQVSIQCDLESPSTSKTPAKNIEPSNQTIERSKVTHEIAIQCADLDSDEPLAQALMKERRASQRQQALANIAKLPVQGDRDRNSQPISVERLDDQGEGSSKKDTAKSITPSERQQALANIAKLPVQGDHDRNSQPVSVERLDDQGEEVSSKKDKANLITPSQRQQALANIAKLPVQGDRDRNSQPISVERLDDQGEVSSKKDKAKSITPSQRQQALANIAKLPVQGDRDRNSQPISVERLDDQGEGSSKKDKAKSITPSERLQALANIAKLPVQGDRDRNSQPISVERLDDQGEEVSSKKDKAKSITPSQRQQALANIAKLPVQGDRDRSSQPISVDRLDDQGEVVSSKKDKTKSLTLSQRQQALANIAKLPIQGDRDRNSQPISVERLDDQGEGSSKKDKAKSITPSERQQALANIAKQPVQGDRDRNSQPISVQRLDDQGEEVSSKKDKSKSITPSQRQQALANIAKLPVQGDRDRNSQPISVERLDDQGEEVSFKKDKLKSITPSQRQQALANNAKLLVQGDRYRNSQPTSLERLDDQGEGSSKEDKAKSITRSLDTPKKEIAARSNKEKSQNNDRIKEKDKNNIKVQSVDSHVTLSGEQKKTKTHKDKEKVQRKRLDNNMLVSAASVCQNNENITYNNKETKKQNVTPESTECLVQNILPKKKRNLKSDIEISRKENPIVSKAKPNLEKKEKVTKEVEKKSKGATRKLSKSKKVTEQKLIIQEKSHSQKATVPQVIPVKQTESKKINLKSNKNKPEIVSLLNNEVRNVTTEKLVTKENPDIQKVLEIPIIITEVIENEMKNQKKTQCIVPVTLTKTQKIISGKQKSDDVDLLRHEMDDKKCDQKSLNINILESEKILPEILKTDSIINLEKENGTTVSHTEKYNEYHQNISSVNATISNSTTKTQDSYVQPKINTENKKPNEEDPCVYNLKPMPQNLTMQGSCEELSVKEITELQPDIPPAHCNIILPVPLDLSGKISSTQSDSPAPYSISTYDDTYETLDLSNKNSNRDSTFNRVFTEEDVVDLRVQYPTHHYESDLSISSMPEEATDLSIGNQQLPKDLSLKGKSRSSSRTSAMQGADYLNIASSRSHYETCTRSKAYDENSCLDFSIKGTARINHPTDLSGKRENRIEPLVSTSSHTESRSALGSNNMHVSATENICNTMNFNNSRMNTYSTYNNSSNKGTSSHSDRPYINPTPIISSEHVPKESFEPAINLLKHKAYIGPEVLSTSQELPEDYYLSTMTNESSCIDMSKKNEQLINIKENFIAAIKMPLGLSESVNTSIPEYNLSNRVVVTSKKYESTTPVYTHANACISISKVETNNSNSFTNTLMSIPGSTITNTTSVYTLAGTTTGTPINYAAECNPMTIDIEPQSLKDVNDMESSYPKTNKSIEVIANEDKLQCKIERKLENLEQDPDTAKKIALLPKELAEILGTMPVDHRKQLLNVLPQYVSTASKPTTQSSDIDQINPQKCVTSKKALSPDLNEIVHTNLDTRVEKRQHLHVPTTPPSTLSDPSSQLSPTSISSSFLLTPPTPNIGRQIINEQKDLKTADCESYKNINTNIIDLTEDDNSQSMPEAEVHTTTETTNVQPFKSKNNDKQSVPPIPNATKINHDKTASLRAVRIKTQSERQRSAFPDLKIRKDSSEVPVTPLQHIDVRDKVDTKCLKIQQGEISSSQCITRNVDCEISSSVSINTETEVKSDGYLKSSEKEILQPNMIVGTSCEVGSKQILDRVPGYKRYDVCSTTLDKSNDSGDLKDNVQVSAPSSPSQLDKIISNNNNVLLKSKSKDDNKMTSQVEDATSKQVKKSSEDDDSDDDISLAVIVKQRNRKILDVKSDKHPRESDIITKGNSVTSYLSNAEMKIDTSIALKTNVKIPEKSQSIIMKNSADHSKNYNSNTEVKNKKKNRKTRRINNLNANNANKSLQQPTDTDFDINKENTKTLDSENIKRKEANIKQMPIEQDSGCVSSSNSDKDLISLTDDKHNNKILEEHDIPKKNMDDASQADSSKDKLNERKFLELMIDSQTSIKSNNHKSLQETVKPDINDLQSSISYVDPVEKEIPKLNDDSKESTTENLKQKNNVTPLRRSRRGKSLFIDSQVIVNTEESTLSLDIVSGQKMPLTKKQLIFSKLLLDEEHNVAPPVSNNCEKVDNHAVTDQSLNNTPNVVQDHIIQNYLSENEIEQQTNSASKTNKRKKAVQLKSKSKKKKLQQENCTSIEDKNQLEDDNTFTSKKDFNLTVSKSIEKSQDDIEVSKGNPNSVENSLTSPDKEELLQKNKDPIDNTLNPTCTVLDIIQNKHCPVEKRKPDIASDTDSAMSSLPKKSKVNDIKKDDLVPKKQEDMQTKKVLINLDSTITDKVKTRTTCYNKPIAAKRPRSKSVFVNSSEYYDPYDIDLEEMNETPESLNRKVSLRKPNSSKTRKTPAANLSTKSDIKNKRVSECCDAVPSTSKTVTDVEKTQNKEEKEAFKVSNKTLTDTKESICDSDDSSKSDVPLKKYVEEKERKMLDSIEKSNNNKQVHYNKDSNATTNSKTKKKVKRSSVVSNKTDDIKIQNSESEAQLRSEKFMESFGFFSERKPRKSNLLATKKISETLHIIANETDDVYFGLKERSNKKTSDKRHADEEKNKGNSKEAKQEKKAVKRGRKKKNSTLIECSYCQLCKKEFRRPDNFLRHQMSVGHVTKISEIELKIKVPLLEEEPNYLLAFKLQLDRVKMLHEKIAKRKILSLPTTDITIPNLEEILADAKRSVREKQIINRGLSRDEALFIDCCELLKASHNKNVRKIEKVRHCSSLNCTQSSTNELDWFARSIDDKNDDKNDGDVDSITARNILESDEVRNLENDLISGLREAAKATKRNIATFNFDNLREIIPDGIINLATCGLVNPNYGKTQKEDKIDQPKIAPKRSPEYKEKMYPDINIESIDMFEDKFDKIKRKCRSQAAAASKQPQATPEASYKVRKNKKKGKKNIRNHQNTVLTKAALKGFDGIKVSIVTAEINMSGIMTSTKKSSKRKKKNQSKRKRERKYSEVSSKAYDSKQDDPPQKKLDIYEFMDTDDAEVFDFRPSTIMERFKSISNKEIPSTSKNIAKYDEADVSSNSASDGDDFVYMSDDYVCSDDETENSVISCEIKNVIDHKKSPHKRRDTTEKSAVMGKIFKHNALRTEKKISKSKEIEQPKANLDQLFDSLLEEQPQTSKLANQTITSKSNEDSSQRYLKTSSPKASNQSDNDDAYDVNTRVYDGDNFYRDTVNDDDIDMQSFKVDRRSTCSNTTIKRPTLYAIKPVEDHDTKATANKYKDSVTCLYSERSITKNIPSARDEFDTFSKRKEMVASPESVDESNSDNTAYNRHKSTDKSRDSKKFKSLKSHDKQRRVSFDCNSESLDATNMSDDAGVARQRVRRKCTVGKQNVLAETWSSESEPDGMPPRPNSAESVVGNNRRRKGRKKEGHSGKKLKLVKRNELESRVSKGEYENTKGGFARPGPSLTAQATVKSRRPAPHYWSEGEDEQEHVQQHGWIVGDSHKKLVTMLAHAKGRKRDDKRSVVE